MADQITGITTDLISADSKKYVGLFDLSLNDPLANIVPLVTDGFFGPKVVNVICFTGPYDWDDISATRNRLIETFNLFTQYELHLVIDADSDDAKDDLSGVDDLDSRLTSLASELSGYGVIYHGKLNTIELTEMMQEIYDNLFN